MRTVALVALTVLLAGLPLTAAAARDRGFDPLDRSPGADIDLPPPGERGREIEPGSGGGPGYPARKVRQVRHEVEVRIVGGVAVTTVDRTFRNDGWRPAGFAWEDQVPEGTVVTGLSILKKGTRYPGSVLEATGARSGFGTSGWGQVLVEKTGPRLRTFVSGIPGRGEVGVRTRTVEVLARRNGDYAAVVPLRSIGDRGVARAAFSVDARSAWPIFVTLPRGFPFRRIPNADPRRYEASFNVTDFRPRRDLVVRSCALPRIAGVTFHVRRTPGGDRFFMAVVAAGDRRLSRPELEIEGATTAEVFPEKIPSLARGRVVHVVGRITGRGPATAVLRGRRAGADLELRAEPQTGDADFVPALWAYEKARASRDEGEIVHLGQCFGVMTKGTALLAK